MRPMIRQVVWRDGRWMQVARHALARFDGLRRRWRERRDGQVVLRTLRKIGGPASLVEITALQEGERLGESRVFAALRRLLREGWVRAARREMVANPGVREMVYFSGEV